MNETLILNKIFLYNYTKQREIQIEKLKLKQLWTLQK